jgi:hypothetical protein
MKKSSKKGVSRAGRKKRSSGGLYFDVPIVRKDKLHLWHEFWDRKPQTRRAKRANRDASLGQTVIVKARNKKDAAKVAESENPGFVAIKDAIGRGLR